MFAMPSPEKVVRQSVRVCMRHGMTKRAALNRVVRVCDAVLISVEDESLSLQEWIVRIRTVAITALGRPPAGTIEDWRN